MPCVKKETIYNRDSLKGISHVNHIPHQTANFDGKAHLR